MLGPHQFFGLIKSISSIYERLVMAKTLLKEQSEANLGDD